MRYCILVGALSFVAGVGYAKPPVNLDKALEETLAESQAKEGERPSVTQLLDPGQLEAMLTTRLEEEVSLSLKLIELNGEDCESATPVLFRLGDLYWEKSKRAFFQQNDMKLTKQEREAAALDMKRFQSETVRWYRQIVEQCPDYENMPKVLYYLGRGVLHSRLHRVILPQCACVRQ